MTSMPAFSPGRAWAMARKEVMHVVRDPFTLVVALGIPLALVLFFGYAINFNTRDVRLLCLDQDHSRASRQFLEVFTSSGYFNLQQAPLAGDLLREFDSERVKAAVIIKHGFMRDLGRGDQARAQVLLDGADNSTAGIIMGYLAGIGQAGLQRLAKEPQPQPIRLATRFLFNPELNSQWFIVPGLIVVVMAILSILLTALTVAREWETGSMELLLSTPVRPLEIILGKLAPYLALVLISVSMVYILARLGFGVPFRGSHWLLLLGCLLFLIPSLAQGLIISVMTRQQQLAMQLAFVTGMLPSLLLSGFIFPIQSMPAAFQYLTAVLTPRWFVEILRGIFLKGSGVAELLWPICVLLVLNVLLVTVAMKRFKRDLEP